MCEGAKGTLRGIVQVKGIARFERSGESLLKAALFR
jgi:hypothetical protein